MTKKQIEELRERVKAQNKTVEDRIKYDWVIETYLKCPEKIPTFIIQMDDYCDNEKEITKAKAFKVVLCWRWLNVI